MRQTRSCLQWASVLVAEDRQWTQRHINAKSVSDTDERSEEHNEVTARHGQVVRRGLLGRWYWRWALFFFNWGIIDMEHYINFRCTTKQFHNCIYCEMISTMRLANVHHHRELQIFFLWWELLRPTLLATVKHTTQLYLLQSHAVHGIPSTSHLL